MIAKDVDDVFGDLPFGVAAGEFVMMSLADASRAMYCENVKNITVSLDDETYRRARVAAAERDTSVSNLVKQFLVALGLPETAAERLKREEHALREKITRFSASGRLSRNALHERDR
jgi:hypothetical protein